MIIIKKISANRLSANYDQKKKIFENHLSMNELFLIIGNGCTLNYLNHIETNIDSSKPFTGFGINDDYFDEIMLKIPEIKRVIDSYSTIENDFDLLQVFLSEYKHDDKMICYMKRYVTLAYSKFQIEIEKNNKINSWGFSEWLKKNKHRLKNVYSLNYDLVAEAAMNNAEINYCRPFSSEHLEGKNYKCYLYKPHGSIDFDLPENIISMPEASLWSSIIGANNIISNRNLQIIKPNSYLKPRIQQDIVLPCSENDQLNLNWVEKLYKHLCSRIQTVEKVVIFGFGYRQEDRSEFDHILKVINSNKVVTFYNIGYKNNNTELEKHIVSYNHKYVFIDSDKHSWEEILNII